VELPPTLDIAHCVFTVAVSSDARGQENLHVGAVLKLLTQLPVVPLEAAATPVLVAIAAELPGDDALAVLHAAFVQCREVQPLAIRDVRHVLQQLRRVELELVRILELLEVARARAPPAFQ
jgi:hypothetical protein